MRQPLDGCEPSAAMCATASMPDHPPDPGGVPEIVRRSLRPSLDSRPSRNTPASGAAATRSPTGSCRTCAARSPTSRPTWSASRRSKRATPRRRAGASSPRRAGSTSPTETSRRSPASRPHARAKRSCTSDGAVLLPSFHRRDDEVPGSMRSKVVRCAPSRTPASSVTTAKASGGDGSCATNVATRRSAACSRTSSSSPPLVVGATRNGRPARRACQVGGGRRVAAVRSR